MLRAKQHLARVVCNGMTSPAPPAARATGIGGTVVVAAVKTVRDMTIDFTNAPVMDALPSEDGSSKLAAAGERPVDL